jgi:hypothetical protein
MVGTWAGNNPADARGRDACPSFEAGSKAAEDDISLAGASVVGVLIAASTNNARPVYFRGESSQSKWEYAARSTTPFYVRWCHTASYAS